MKDLHAMPRQPARRGPRALTAHAALAAVLAAALLPAGSAAQKPALDHDAYDAWLTIRGERISPDGDRVLYQLAPRVGDAELVVTRPGARQVRIDRAGDARFSPDSRFAVFTIAPAHDSVRALRIAKTPEAELPGDTLGILNLADGRIDRIPDVEGWSLPEDAGAIVVYLLEAGDPEEAGEQGEALEPEPEVAPEPTPEVVPEPEPVPEPEIVPEPLPEPEPAPGPGHEPGAGDEEEKAGDRDRPATHTLVIRDLASGVEHRFENVTGHVLSKDGRRVAIATAAGERPEGGGPAGEDGVYVVDTGTGAVEPLITGPGRYQALAFDDQAARLAFLTDRDDPDADRPEYALYAWREGRGPARRVAAQGTAGIPEGWWVSEHGELEFSASGARLYFGTAPRPAPEPEDSLLDDERVRLDVWHWQDDVLQPMQLVNLERERKRTYRAVAHVDAGSVVQLATPELPAVRLTRDGDADVALAETDVPYRHLIGIESPGYSDIWLIDVRTGERRHVARERQAAWVTLSPEGQFVAWYDHEPRQWRAVPTAGGEAVTVSEGIPHALWDEDDDHPMPARPYGMAGWTAGDRDLLIYDRYDVWALDPAGDRTPRALTDGRGRAERLRFRVVDLDPEEPAFDPGAPLLLSALDERTKDAGFFQVDPGRSAAPRELVRAPKRFSTPDRARDADVLLFTREDVAEFPDLWVADGSFRNARRVSRANPQRSGYNWATVELVEWLNADGVSLRGLLYRPEDFDPRRRYPLMVTFYERDSDNLHEHHPPLPHRSVIRPTFYASRGYVVFVPDIVYTDGYPGESAMKAIMPGVLRLAEEPWIDEANVGIQGHSWGGYQIAYMVTRTNFFKAAGAGAPVANMTSAYGGIRWETGLSRMFQYERTQSRIGAPLWDAPRQYLENSPLFFLDKVQTPVLIMHNDEDGHVPWYQGIELFVALRRLGKPAWLINYNDQPHWPVTAANIRDWNIRMQQYFDHFLKGEPAPVWLAEGLPATEKGRTLGLDPAGIVPPGEEPRERPTEVLTEVGSGG